MLMHEKLMSGQFFELKNERTSLLHHHHQIPLHHLQHQHLHQQQHQQQLHQEAQHQQLLQQHHHQQQQHQHELHHSSASASHMPAALKMDLYKAYAYQQQLEQQLISAGNGGRQNAGTTAMEVLDLSRRCDSVETPRKTPSPYETNLSYGSVDTPASSPNITTETEITTTPTSRSSSAEVTAAATAVTAAAVANATTSIIPTNLLYSAQAQKQGLATLHPALYYTNGIKQEASINGMIGSSALSTAGGVASPKSQSTQVSTNTASLLHSFAAASAATIAAAAAAAVAAPSPMYINTSNNLHETLASPTRHKLTPTVASISPKSDNITTVAMATTPTSSIINNNSNSLNAESDKNTRPFKAFPRDPLVIAANFAATDILLDNPRAERYTEYRKRVLEQIRNSNGGSRTITNPKMRRTNSRSGSINEGSLSNNNSESDDRLDRVEESSDCDSNAGNFEKLSHIETSIMSTNTLIPNNDNNNTSLSNPNCNGSQIKDAAYYERRRKNNAAAKKSRDRRRIKEDEIAIRAAYLERQNIELLCQIDSLKAQLAAFTSKVNV